MFEEERTVAGYELWKGMQSDGEFGEAKEALGRLVDEYYRVAVRIDSLLREKGEERRNRFYWRFVDEVCGEVKEGTWLNRAYLRLAFGYVVLARERGVPVERGVLLLGREVFGVRRRFMWIRLPVRKRGERWIFERKTFDMWGDVKKLEGIGKPPEKGGKVVKRAWLVVPGGDVENGVFAKLVLSRWVPVCQV